MDLNTKKKNTFRSSPEIEDRTCFRCGVQPTLISKYLDTRRSVTIRMFECVCGEHSWSEDRE